VLLLTGWDDCALTRLRDAFGNRRARRAARAGADRGHLQRVAAFPICADHEIDDPRFTMLMMFIGIVAALYYVMSYLHISQSAAESIVAMHLPPLGIAERSCSMVSCSASSCAVSIILMTAPIILPRCDGQFRYTGSVSSYHRNGDGADSPAQVGLNIFVIRNVAPDIPLSESDLGPPLRSCC